MSNNLDQETGPPPGPQPEPPALLELVNQFEGRGTVALELGILPTEVIVDEAPSVSKKNVSPFALAAPLKNMVA
jgi:hypothetical protein